MFVEAEADVALEELGDSIGQPFLHRKHFFYEVPVISRNFWLPFVVDTESNANISV